MEALVFNFTLCRTCARLRGRLRSRDSECAGCWAKRWSEEETRMEAQRRQSERTARKILGIVAVACLLFFVIAGATLGAR